MAIVAMADAVSGGVALSAEYNKLIDNIEDIDARVGGVVAANSAHVRLNSLESITANVSTGNSALGTRVTSLESLTTNTSGNVGIGNQRLSDRLGSGVSNTTNVTTGTATAQLTDVRSRLTTVEGAVNPPGAWVAISSFSNGWSFRSGFPQLSVRTLPGDNVQIFGTLWRSAGASGPGTVVCTIPVGYRPPGSTVVFGMDNNNKIAGGEILSTGAMQLKIPIGETSGTVSWSHIYYIGSGIAVQP